MYKYFLFLFIYLFYLFIYLFIYYYFCLLNLIFIPFFIAPFRPFGLFLYKKKGQYKQKADIKKKAVK